MDLKPLADFSATAFNPLNYLPMSEWLEKSQSENAQARLKALGNVVVPQCGELGMELLLRLKLLSEQ